MIRIVCYTILVVGLSMGPVWAATVTPTAKPALTHSKKKIVKNTLSQKKKSGLPSRQKQAGYERKAAKYQVTELKKSIRRSWDFQDPSIEKIPQVWESLSGQWKIVVEPEHPGNRVVQQKAIKRNFQYLMSKQQFVNFEFSARMRTDMFEQKTRNWQLGLIFRQADPNYYYKFRITAANIALLRCSPQKETVLPGQIGNSRAASVTGRFGKSDEHLLMILPWKYTQDSWHTLTVVCYGERIILKLDGREIRMMDDAMIGSGKVGVFTYKTRAFIDDLRLYYLPVPEAAKTMVFSANPFSLKKDRELLIYYTTPVTGLLEMKVLTPNRQLFTRLSRGIHYQGIGSVVWNGQGLDGGLPKPGLYTVVWDAKGIKKSKQIKIIP
ncbi:hypothetical protein K8S19_06680 [bacterium]|nr:hypothetical protein [bacterium]